MLKKLFCIAFFSLASFSSLAKEKCPTENPIYISTSTWESSYFVAYLHKYLYENLFEGCQIELLDTPPLSTVALIMSQRIDIIPEIWYHSVNMLIKDAEMEGKIRMLSETYQNANEGWFVPKYMIEQHPELEHAADLIAYNKQNPPKKGPIPVYNCPVFWTCHDITRHLFKAYGLEEDFVLVNSSSPQEMEEKIIHDYLLRKPFVTYYWSPTPLLGAIKIKQLKMNPFNAEDYQCLVEKECPNPKATSFAETLVLTGVSDKFYQQSPEIVNIIKNIKLSAQDVSDLLNWKATHRRSYEQTVHYFLLNYPHIWKSWLKEDQIQHIKQNLSD